MYVACRLSKKTHQVGLVGSSSEIPDWLLLPGLDVQCVRKCRMRVGMSPRIPSESLPWLIVFLGATLFSPSSSYDDKEDTAHVDDDLYR